MERGNAQGSGRSSHTQQRSSGRGWPNHWTFESPSGGNYLDVEPTVARRTLRTETGETAMDTKTGNGGETAPGHTGGARPRRANGARVRAGADLGAGLCPTQLRFRPGRSAQQATQRVETLLQQGYTW